jgi:dolichol-phosphate mannosyltransferase
MSSQPFLSIVIPAHNEAGCIASTCQSIVAEFHAQSISDFEILVVNDNSSDHTEAILQDLQARESSIRYVNNPPPHGFGFAVRRGLEEFKGEAVAIVMGDLSDSPRDILAYYRTLKNGAECVFGSRFVHGATVYDYPRHKLVLNRLANWFIKFLFGLEHNDITNAFKAYRREVIVGVQPLLSHHFNLTVELPLKAVTRGFTFETIPISWTNRKTGVSKLKIKEMGSRYLFITLYIWLEKHLSKGDYVRTPRVRPPVPPQLATDSSPRDIK